MLKYFQNDKYYVLDYYNYALPKKFSRDSIVLHNIKPLINLDSLYNPRTDIGEALLYSPLKSKFATDYGTIIHKLLEIYFSSKNITFVINHPIFKYLNDNSNNCFIEKFLSLNNIGYTQELLKKELKCEVTFGLHDGISSIGRLDLLAIKDKEIVILDYKTDKSVPVDSSEIPNSYIDQLKNYKMLIEKFYSEYTVLVKILWFENLSYMNVKI